MNRLKLRILARVAVGFAALAWMLVLAPATATAQQRGYVHEVGSALPSVSAKAETRKAAEQQRRGGPHEGIKVSGRWVIEVRNRDGSLATRREFENTFVGQRVLVEILTGQVTPGPWIVLLRSSAQTGPCDANGQPEECGLYQGQPQRPLGGVATASTTLTVAALTSPQEIQLKGTATVTANSSIDGVDTAITVCDKTIAPATSCQVTSGPVFPFTTASAPQSFAPVPVAADQIVQVTVTISFS
ncbi:MAG TPA: hypothetical protein VFQ00_04360 [Terriglobales bacterium]|nr:hypothetical protein [Terriglobales bacterium]